MSRAPMPLLTSVGPIRMSLSSQMEKFHLMLKLRKNRRKILLFSQINNQNQAQSNQSPRRYKRIPKLHLKNQRLNQIPINQEKTRIPRKLNWNQTKIKSSLNSLKMILKVEMLIVNSLVCPSMHKTKTEWILCKMLMKLIRMMLTSKVSIHSCSTANLYP